MFLYLHIIIIIGPATTIILLFGSKECIKKKNQQYRNLNPQIHLYALAAIPRPSECASANGSSGY
jgi:hypothetical protein